MAWYFLIILKALIQKIQRCLNYARSMYMPDITGLAADGIRRRVPDVTQLGGIEKLVIYHIYLLLTDKCYIFKRLLVL